MAAGKGLKVIFNTPVSHGFKPDTKGFEAAEDANGNMVACSVQFAPGEEFAVPEAEREEFEALLDSGACREA